MASYHLSVHPPVSRGKGQSVVATAAYNGRTRLVDESSGRVWDYRSLGATLFSGIYAPKDAPEWASDLQRLVSEIERVEKRSDAQLAFNIDIALPHELTLEQSRRLAQDFVREEWQRKGYAVIVDIHAPDPKGDDRNTHMHVWGTLRKIGKDGFAATKAEQQDNYRNRSAYTEYLREKWERLANRHLERAGFDVRIDRRSLRDQGILDREPEQHRGPELTVIDRDGRETRINDEIRRRREQLAELRRLQAEERQLQAEERQLQAEKAQIINLAAARADRQNPHIHGQPDRRRRGQSENEDMDEDIAAKQRQQRQQIEDREASRYNDMVAERNRADRFIQEWQIGHDHGERNKRTLQEGQWEREAQSDIADVRVRALIAAGESRDFVQAVRREGAMITAEHAELQRDIALEKDPDKKHVLELKRDIQQADYMALANERVASMSNLNSEQYKDAQRQQEAWSNIGTDLRKERLELQERMIARDFETINEAVQKEAAQKIDTADRQRAEFRADIRGPVAAADQEPKPDLAAYSLGDIETEVKRRVDKYHRDNRPSRNVARATEQDNKTPDATSKERDAAVMKILSSDMPALRVAEAIDALDAAAPAPGQPATRTTDPQRPSEVIHLGPSVPERDAQPTTSLREVLATAKSARETTDARQVESATAENVEITDAKAASKAKWARHGVQVEQAIESARDRGFENSR